MKELDYIKVTNKTVLFSMLELSRQLLSTEDLGRNDITKLVESISLLYQCTQSGIEELS